MRSLRRYFILLLLSAFALIQFTAAVQAYRAGTASVERALDQQLRDHVELLAAHGLSVRDVSSLRNPDLAFQVLAEDGRLLERSDSAPDAAFMLLRPGYADINFSGARWRALADYDAMQGRWILFAQRLVSRNQLVDSVIIATILPSVLGIPVAGLLIWLVVGRGLRPLNLLSQQLRDKPADDLAPVSLPEQPRELEPVIVAMNQWLARLEAAFVRERHFASDAAHELRTPISTLKVHLHNLRSARPDLAGWDALTCSVQSLEHLVEQMLMLYRTAPDHFAGQLQRLSLDALVQEVIAHDYDGIAGRDQHIELVATPLVMAGNRFALEAMVSNLVSNASKYTPPGGHILITLTQHAGQALLTIEDSGPGIPADQRQRVLERFHRLPSAAGGQAPGCGLGLAIVQHVVDQHGGSLSLDVSPSLHGLHVSVRLPLRPEDREENRS